MNLVNVLTCVDHRLVPINRNILHQQKHKRRNHQMNVEEGTHGTSSVVQINEHEERENNEPKIEWLIFDQNSADQFYTIVAVSRPLGRQVSQVTLTQHCHRLRCHHAR